MSTADDFYVSILGLFAKVSFHIASHLCDTYMLRSDVGIPARPCP